MQSIAPYLPRGSSAADATAMIAAQPAVAATLAALRGPNRSRVRGLIKRDYCCEVADALVPVGAPGRPRDYDGHWALLSCPTRTALAGVIGKPLEDAAAADWTVDCLKAGADIITARYVNSTSAAMSLRAFRVGLQAIGVPNAMLTHTARPDITAAHNAKIQARTGERIAAGITVPPPYERIADLRARVEAFIDCAPVSPQTVADFLVAFSARPGEAATIDIGPGGGVTGVLKKRGAADEFPIVSALGEPLAVSFMAAWKRSPLAARKKAIVGLSALVETWGLQKRDLRAVGAALAVRAAAIDGAAENEGRAREIHRAALRHAAPLERPAQDHYQRVNDPVAQLCANIAELNLADRQKVEELLRTLGEREAGLARFSDAASQ